MKKSFAKFLSIILSIITIFSIGTMGITASAASVITGTAKTDSYYSIYNVGSKKMLNVYGSKNKSNTNVTVYAKDNTSGQSVKSYSHGTMDYNGVKFTKYFFVFKCATSCALNVYGSSSKEGSNVNIWTKSGNNTQDWILEYVPSKSGYIIRSANNPKYVLTASGSKNSSNVCLTAYSSSNNYQIWQSDMFKKSNSQNNETSENKWMWPTSGRRITCGFADNYYHTSHWHRGIDISVSCGTKVYASKSGKVALVVGDTSSRGRYVVIDHGDGYYSEYQHLQSVSVKEGDTVKQGDVIAKSGNTNGTNSGGAAHLHFEIMNLGKSGLGKKYTSYWNSYSKYVNTNPKNTDKVYCTKSNSSFVIRQQKGSGIPTANLVKTNNTAPYGVYCYDSNGINYIFK